jgi:hypothetical protein
MRVSFLESFTYVSHWLFDQCEDVVAIAGTLTLPMATAVATATVAILFVRTIEPPWIDREVAIHAMTVSTRKTYVVLIRHPKTDQMHVGASAQAQSRSGT